MSEKSCPTCEELRERVRELEFIVAIDPEATWKARAESAETKLAAGTAALRKADALLGEYYASHRDSQSTDYNECEEAQCAWCDGVDDFRAALAKVQP